MELSVIADNNTQSFINNFIIGYIKKHKKNLENKENLDEFVEMLIKDALNRLKSVLSMMTDKEIPENLLIDYIKTWFNEKIIDLHKTGGGVSFREENTNLPNIAPKVYINCLNMENHKRWDKLRERLVKTVGAEAVDVIDKFTDLILGYVSKITENSVNEIRGLVVGYVQSGKTTNYTSLIAKCADMGFRFFIILTNHINTLRNQTQERLDYYLYETDYGWYRLTDTRGDNVEQILRKDPHKVGEAVFSERPVYGVFKKNSNILRNLVNYIKEMFYIRSKSDRGDKRQSILDFPVLIIDDEADFASINTKGGRKKKKRIDDEDIPDETERTAINKLIIDLLGLFKKKVYIGYTATPYANLFTDVNEKDLYPKDFIIALPKPKGYIGVEDIFVDYIPDEEDIEDYDNLPLDAVEYIPYRDIELIIPVQNEDIKYFNPEIPPSLKEAVRYFINVCACGLENNMESNFTMLVNVVIAIALQRKICSKMRSYIHALKKEFRSNPKLFYKKQKENWESIYLPKINYLKSLDPRIRLINFEFFADRLPEIIENIEVYDVNSESKVNIFDLYKNAERKPFIFIGGYILSRGLTLQGLFVSYFLRSSTVADSLLQMARWQGFIEYPHLIRVWTTEEIAELYQKIIEMDENLRNEIEVCLGENRKPDEFLFVLKHSDSVLRPTSSNKMRNVTIIRDSASIIKDIQTTWFRNNRDWLAGNINAVSSFIAGLIDNGYSYELNSSNNIIFRNVGSDMVLDFLKNYKWENRYYKLPEMKRIIPGVYKRLKELVHQNREIDNWSVVIISKKNNKRGSTLKLGPLDVNLLERGCTRRDENVIFIRAIRSRRDILADLNKREWRKFEQYRAKNQMSPSKIYKYYREVKIKKPILLIYPIDKNSKARPNTSLTDLNAEEHLIGLSWYLPRNISSTMTTYIKYINRTLLDRLNSK